jgi:hypothetical protein
MNTSAGKTDENCVQGQAKFASEPVWVQCEGFRCLAYMNQKGEWRAYSSGVKLSDVVKVLTDPLNG